MSPIKDSAKPSWSAPLSLDSRPICAASRHVMSPRHTIPYGDMVAVLCFDTMSLNYRSPYASLLNFNWNRQGVLMIRPHLSALLAVISILCLLNSIHSLAKDQAGLFAPILITTAPFATLHFAFGDIFFKSLCKLAGKGLHIH